MALVEINQSLCKGCGLCAHNCPKKSVIMSEKINSSGYCVAEFADRENCNGCALCAVMCPDLAIRVLK